MVKEKSTVLVEEFKGIRSKINQVLETIELPELSNAINTIIEEKSYARKIFTVDKVSGENQATYPLQDEFEAPVWVLPGIGYTSQDYVELLSEEFNVRMFTVQVAKDWLLKYLEEKRFDVMRKAAEAAGRVIADYEIEACWRTILPAVTSSFDGAGVLPPRPAQIHQLPLGDPGSGYLSKEIINRLIIAAKRSGHKLKKILISPEDLGDIREWTDTDVDGETRNHIFQAAGLGEIWGIDIVEMDDLGIRGKFNINDSTSEWGPFKGQTSNTYNNYQITHGNVLDENGNLVRAGETQIIGLCESHHDNLIMPLIPYVAHFDWTLLRRQKMGFFGWEKLGMACTDSRCLLMGIIDRFVPEAPREIKTVRQLNSESFSSQMANLLRRN